jgi:hypothetical protein
MYANTCAVGGYVAHGGVSSYIPGFPNDTFESITRDIDECAYTMAWQRYYTVEHAEMIIRWAAVTKANVSNAVFMLT